MSRLRITCKAERPIERREFVPGFPVMLSIPASWSDVSVTLVSDDGTEHEITNVEGITWRVSQGEMATATLEFTDVDLDVEAEPGPEAKP